MAMWRSGSIARGTPQVQTGRPSLPSPAVILRRLARWRLLRLSSERTHERAALVGIRPGGIEAFALELIGQRVGRHGVIQLGERAIPDLFVAADVVAFAKC